MDYIYSTQLWQSCIDYWTTQIHILKSKDTQGVSWRNGSNFEICSTGKSIEKRIYKQRYVNTLFSSMASEKCLSVSSNKWKTDAILKFLRHKNTTFLYFCIILQEFFSYHYKHIVMITKINTNLKKIYTINYCFNSGLLYL